MLNVIGVRVVAVSAPCDRGQVFFGPALGFKAIVKTAMRQQWRQPTSRSLGERSQSRSARDLEFLQRKAGPIPVVILAPVNVTISSERPRRGSQYEWKLPRDLDPTQPPQLHSKK